MVQHSQWEQQQVSWQALHYSRLQMQQQSPAPL
jgi:hypothetical protein